MSLCLLLMHPWVPFLPLLSPVLSDSLKSLGNLAELPVHGLLPAACHASSLSHTLLQLNLLSFSRLRYFSITY